MDKWAIYDTKKAFLDSLISKMPGYLNDLLTPESIQAITAGYTEGPRQTNRELQPLQVTIPDDFLSVEQEYEYGGIVFCPHRENFGFLFI